jgi:uncharacterized protein YggE
MKPAMPSALWLLAGCVFAQAPPVLPPPTPPPFIRTTGEATVMARPDQVRIDIGVVTQAPTAEAAGSQNAARADAVLRELRRAAGPNAEIRTSGYALEPNYRAPRPGGAPEISGYTARNTVEVITGDLAVAGKLIDAAMQAGANSIQRLEFTLKDRRAARAQALREATLKARAGAETIAAALGVKILRVLAVEEGTPEPPIRPMAVGMARMEAAAPTPIEPGTVDVQATVSLRVEVSP